MPPKEDNEKKITSIHTLESDLASAVNDKDYGQKIVKIITNPDKKFVLPENKDIPFSSKINNIFNKKILLYLISIIVIAVIIFAVYIFYKINNVNKENINTADILNSTSTIPGGPIINNNNILNSEIIQSSDFSRFNRFEIIDEIKKIKDILINSKINPNNNISINTNLTSKQFFEKIRYSGGEGLLRSLNDNYAFGLYSLKEKGFETYLLIEVDNFDLAFKSILEWERYIGIDLKDIFISNNFIKENSQEDSSTTTLSSTTQNIRYIKNNTDGFVDKILKNQDIREYVKNEDNLNIIYGFIGNKYLLITSGESSFIDIRDRLLKENIIR